MENMPPDPNTWAGVIADLQVQYGWSQSKLADRLGVSQQSISGWLRGSTDTPSIQTVRAVHRISGDSMLRLISVAYGWPLSEVAQGAVLDAVIVDSSLEDEDRRHFVDQYNILLRHSRALRAEREDEPALDGEGMRDVREDEPPLDDV